VGGCGGSDLGSNNVLNIGWGRCKGSPMSNRGGESGRLINGEGQTTKEREKSATV